VRLVSGFLVQRGVPTECLDDFGVELAAGVARELLKGGVYAD
jgi:hypothetical protein